MGPPGDSRYGCRDQRHRRYERRRPSGPGIDAGKRKSRGEDRLVREHGEKMNMNGKKWFVVLMIACAIAWIPQAQAQSVPKYEVDPMWPKMPDKWVVGPLGGACIDSNDH